MQSMVRVVSLVLRRATSTLTSVDTATWLPATYCLVVPSFSWIEMRSILLEWISVVVYVTFCATCQWTPRTPLASPKPPGRSMTATVCWVLASSGRYWGVRISLTGPPFAVRSARLWHVRQVFWTGGSLAWSGGSMGVGKLPVTMSKSCLVPLTFGVTHPAKPGLTWQVAQGTWLWGDMAYAFSSGSIV